MRVEMEERRTTSREEQGAGADSRAEGRRRQSVRDEERAQQERGDGDKGRGGHGSDGQSLYCASIDARHVSLKISLPHVVEEARHNVDEHPPRDLPQPPTGAAGTQSSLIPVVKLQTSSSRASLKT